MIKDYDCLTRRRLLNSNNTPPDMMAAIGREMREAGFLSDAVDLAGRANDEELLSELAEQALAEGDLFLLTRVKKILNQPIEEYELKTLARNAAEFGKDSFAARALEMIEDEGRK